MFLLKDFILPNREISSSNTICQQCSANDAKEKGFECVCVCKNPMYIQDFVVSKPSQGDHHVFGYLAHLYHWKGTEHY